MKFSKIALFILLLPLTLFLDFIFYAMLKSCPSCGSFREWLITEGAFSLPIITGLTAWFSQLLPKSFKVAK